MPSAPEIPHRARGSPEVTQHSDIQDTLSWQPHCPLCPISSRILRLSLSEALAPREGLGGVQAGQPLKGPAGLDGTSVQG